MTQRLADAIYVGGRYQPLEKTSEDTETLLYADWHYRHSPVLVCRRVGKGNVACTTLQAYDHPGLQQILYRVLCQLAGQHLSDRSLGDGLLGYAQPLGQAHGLGVEATPGLALKAGCDINLKQLDQAKQEFQLFLIRSLC